MEKYRIQNMLSAVILAFVFCFACSSSEEGNDAGGSMPGAGTGGSTGTGGTGSGGTTGDGGSDASESEVPGGSVFVVELKSALSAEEKNNTLVQGQVCNAPKLAYRMVIWEVTQENEGCKLLEPRTPFCEPPCESPAVCVEDYVCASDPTCYDSGTVTLKGLQNEEGKDSLSLTNVRNQYSLGAAKLLFPPFAEGDSVTLEASGADIEAFTIESRGIAPLEVSTDDGVLMDRNMPLTLEWTAATITDNSRIEIRVDISHHGGQRGEIVCDVADTGSFEIPADLITALIDLGVAGFPSLTVERFALGSTTITAGRVDLRVLSRAERMIDIPGLISCNEPDTTEGCPEGQTCQEDRTCQ